MSETVRYEGKIQLRPRLENETDKEYFERVTGKNWKVFEEYEPYNIAEAIYDNNISYYEAKNGNKGYICLKNNIYEFLECEQKDIEWDYCNITNIKDNTFKFETMFYNGGASLSEVLEDEFDRWEE